MPSHSKAVEHLRPERIAGRRLIDDTPISLADLIHSYRRRTNAARLAIDEAQQAADALNEGLCMVGGATPPPPSKASPISTRSAG